MPSSEVRFSVRSEIAESRSSPFLNIALPMWRIDPCVPVTYQPPHR
jgi:hypothetical protein